MKIGILGAVTWRIALGKTLINCKHEVTVWSAIKEEIVELSETRKQRNFPEIKIPWDIWFTNKIRDVCQDKDVLIFAVPSQFVRETVKVAIPFIKKQIIVSVAKGIEADTHFTMTRVIRDELQKMVLMTFH